MAALRFFILVFLFSGSVAYAKGGGIGINVGLGAPFITQGGVNIIMSDKFSLSVGYNLLDLSSGGASVKLSMPEALINYHPFSGSYFIGAGVGHETLEVTAKEILGNNEASIEVTALTTVVKTGWMWGAANGGFWFGIDFSYIMPSSPEQTITLNGVATTDPNYADAVEAADEFGETAYPNITFARIGWLF